MKTLKQFLQELKADAKELLDNHKQNENCKGDADCVSCKYHQLYYNQYKSYCNEFETLENISSNQQTMITTTKNVVQSALKLSQQRSSAFTGNLILKANHHEKYSTLFVAPNNPDEPMDLTELFFIGLFTGMTDKTEDNERK